MSRDTVFKLYMASVSNGRRLFLCRVPYRDICKNGRLADKKWEKLKDIQNWNEAALDYMPYALGGMAALILILWFGTKGEKK